jgi:hypothetical protein
MPQNRRVDAFGETMPSGGDRAGSRTARTRRLFAGVLNAAAGRFAVVEGTVTRVGEAGGRLFLDFGRRYMEDFTLVVSRGARPTFEKAGVDLKALKGKKVRARGVLFPWGGPAIELRKPAALELVEGEGA